MRQTAKIGEKWDNAAAKNCGNPSEDRAVIKRSLGAGVRAFAVAGLLALPALLLPNTNPDTTQIVMFVAILAALLTFVEYVSSHPSLIEFRSAAPFNRARYFAAMVMVVCVTLVAWALIEPGTQSALLGLASACAALLDFPFSPLRLLTIATQDADQIQPVRLMGGLAFALGLGMVALGLAAIRVLNWPLNRGAFNVLTNLPLFDPTSGGDVLDRLRRDAQFNLALGFLLPFVVPAVLKVATPYLSLLTLSEPQTMIWMVVLWALLPASIVIRGFALFRVADLIEGKRKRTYAQRDEDHFQLV